LKPPPFAYARASSVDEAVALLAADEDAKVLAGGQSLVPMLNFRLARPTTLIDVSRIAGLDTIERDGDELVVRAGVRQRVAEQSSLVRRDCPLIAQALHNVGHMQNRVRGTVCGSLAHCDPAAELGAVALALDATMVAAGPLGVRRIPAVEFFLGPYMSTLAPDELLVEARFPVLDGARAAFVEYARRSGDFAEAGVACAVTLGPDGTVAAARLAAMAVGPRPLRLDGVEHRLVGGPPTDAALAGAAEAVELDPGAAGYKTELVRTLIRRALQEATR
jgi:carbon-monoxide dehydrogenase medium subunit